MIPHLDAGLIPLREFPLHKWYYATPLWYFHAPAQSHSLRPNRRFYELVDPALRELCRLLLEHGILTTPSCQGHFYTRARFDVVWRQLTDSLQSIRAAGLTVRDCETDESCLFRDGGFCLPWADFGAFYADVDAHQSEGYLGLVLRPAHRVLAECLLQDSLRTPAARIEFDADISAVLGHDVFGIHVRAADAESRDAEWAAITHRLRGMVEEMASPPNTAALLAGREQ